MKVELRGRAVAEAPAVVETLADEMAGRQKWENAAVKNCPGSLFRVFRLFRGQNLLRHKVEKNGISPKNRDLSHGQSRPVTVIL
jgi:hypothetical protein